MVLATPSTEPRRHLLTADDVLQMFDTGILADNARVELIEGELIDMTPPNAPHGSAVYTMNLLFFEAVGRRAVIWNQTSVRLSALNLPQPDLAILRSRDDRYRTRLPTISDILLVVEVSDTTLSYDRKKALVYAAQGVPELWIVDVNRQRVIRFRGPGVSGYRKVDEPSGVVAPKRMPKCKINLGELFPGGRSTLRE